MSLIWTIKHTLESQSGVLSPLTAVGFLVPYSCPAGVSECEPINQEQHRTTMLIVNYGYYENRNQTRTTQQIIQSMFSDNLTG